MSYSGEGDELPEVPKKVSIPRMHPAQLPVPSLTCPTIVSRSSGDRALNHDRRSSMQPPPQCAMPAASPEQVQLPSMPIYVLQRRLGKGGFGQVWLGQRLIQRKSTSANKPTQVGSSMGFGCSPARCNAPCAQMSPELPVSQPCILWGV